MTLLYFLIAGENPNMYKYTIRMLRGDAVQAEPGIHCQFFLDHNYCSGEYLTTNTGKEYMTAHLAKFTFVLMHFLLDNVFSQWPFKSYQGVMQYEI